ncbi:MAG: transglycosylase domain-containing protein [Bauldia sp.]|nr:transglycosylase domain-containing protein [Bauldia sp.]
MSEAKTPKSKAKPAGSGGRKATAGKAQPAKKKPSGVKGKSGETNRSGWRRAGRILLIALGILVALPLVLVPVYSFVNPVGTYMIYTRIVDGPLERQWVGFDDIAKVMVVSVMVSEDGQYCSHHGVDWAAIGDVFDSPGGPSRGASTIPMQTVRNLFLWLSRSYVRKGIEIPLALYADAIWSKRREMEIYLNIAQWGPNIFGVEAAAQHYFGRAAADLGPRQAALLAATLPNPLARNPARPSSLMKSLARTIEARARKAGPYIVCLYP